ARLGTVDHARSDFLLTHLVVPRRLADVHKGGPGCQLRQVLGGTEPVKVDDIGCRQRLRGPDGQEVGRTRAAAYEGDAARAPCACHGCLPLSWELVEAQLASAAALRTGMSVAMRTGPAGSAEP